MKFVLARRVKALGTQRYELIWTLRIADFDSTFRFLDLPPELRNQVYKELLQIQPSSGNRKRSCFPQILATSRQIHEEVYNILYKDNEVSWKLHWTTARAVSRSGTAKPHQA